jgi:hypothetical protein
MQYPLGVAAYNFEECKDILDQTTRGTITLGVEHIDTHHRAIFPASRKPANEVPSIHLTMTLGFTPVLI